MCPSGQKSDGPGVAAGPAVADGLVHSGGIRSSQASLIAQLKRINQAINVVQSLEGENSALNNILKKIEAIIKQVGKSLDEGENRPAVISIEELVKDLMNGINAPVYTDVVNYDNNHQVLAYIGKGFSVNISDGGIVFDIEKMFDEVYKRNEKQQDTEKKRQDYRRAMGLVKGLLESQVESLTVKVNKAAGPGTALVDFNQANDLTKDILKRNREESGMMLKSYNNIDADLVMKYLAL